ncbi:MAG: DinB family protein [Anaerolineaceae bacterium]|nr:DinB family protein [Anaerolineaceae bacterium]
MISAGEMTHLLARNLEVIEVQTEGLTHADSMLQLPFRGNCLNWVLGHIMLYRDVMLKLAGAEPLREPQHYRPYGYGSDAMQADDEAVPLETLLADLRRSQDRLAVALAALSEAQLKAEGCDYGDDLRECLLELVWHDGYHAGQTEYLRQVAGVNDQVMVI